MPEPALAVEQCRCHRSTTRAPWLVATPHRRMTLVGADVDYLPYGVRHARQIGGATTACGQPALAWRIFHRLTFRPGARETCRDCSAVIGRVEGAGHAVG